MVQVCYVRMWYLCGEGGRKEEVGRKDGRELGAWELCIYFREREGTGAIDGVCMVYVAFVRYVVYRIGLMTLFHQRERSAFSA